MGTEDHLHGRVHQPPHGSGLVAAGGRGGERFDGREGLLGCGQVGGDVLDEKQVESKKGKKTHTLSQAFDDLTAFTRLCV